LLLVREPIQARQDLSTHCNYKKATEVLLEDLFPCPGACGRFSFAPTLNRSINSNYSGGGHHRIIASTIIPSLYFKNHKSMPAMKTTCTIPNQESGTGAGHTRSLRTKNLKFDHLPFRASECFNRLAPPAPPICHHHHSLINMPAGPAGEKQTFDSSFHSFSGRGENFHIDYFYFETISKLQMLK
jgi:hypothetical protein